MDGLWQSGQELPDPSLIKKRPPADVFVGLMRP
jgi:hypothetical protein